jgi:transposase
MGTGNIAGQKRDFDALERRRFEALRLYQKGVNQSEIARDLRVARQTVVWWVPQYRREGKQSVR